ncbi:hypothetical protein L345_17846, partial [Ophiophagus hannah]
MVLWHKQVACKLCHLLRNLAEVSLAEAPDDGVGSFKHLAWPPISSSPTLCLSEWCTKVWPGSSRDDGADSTKHSFSALRFLAAMGSKDRFIPLIQQPEKGVEKNSHCQGTCRSGGGGKEIPTSASWCGVGLWAKAEGRALAHSCSLPPQSTLIAGEREKGDKKENWEIAWQRRGEKTILCRFKFKSQEAAAQKEVFRRGQGLSGSGKTAFSELQRKPPILPQPDGPSGPELSQREG